MDMKGFRFSIPAKYKEYPVCVNRHVRAPSRDPRNTYRHITVIFIAEAGRGASHKHHTFRCFPRPFVSPPPPPPKKPMMMKRKLTRH